MNPIRSLGPYEALLGTTADPDRQMRVHEAVDILAESLVTFNGERICCSKDGHRVGETFVEVFDILIVLCI